VNLGLLLCLLPVPGAVRVGVSVLVLLALAAFLPLMVLGARASVRARREALAATSPTRTPVTDLRPSVWQAGQLVAAVSALAVVVSLGVAYDPAAAGLVAGSGTGPAAAPVAATDETTTVQVVARE